MNIPKGYQIRITSSEGDGDYKKVEIISGLTEADVWFYIDLAEQFKISDGYPTEDDYINNVVSTVLNRHPLISNAEKEYWSEDTKCQSYRDRIQESFLGYIEEESLWGSNYLRCVEGYEVFYYPEQVEEVTKNFDSRKLEQYFVQVAQSVEAIDLDSI